MTRKGGINAEWPQLREGQKAINDMRNDTIDLASIVQQHRDEEVDKRAKERRRLENKRRYQPRSQWRKEKEEAKERAVAKAQKQLASLQTYQVEQTKDLADGPAAKRPKLKGHAEEPDTSKY